MWSCLAGGLKPQFDASRASHPHSFVCINVSVCGLDVLAFHHLVFLGVLLNLLALIKLLGSVFYFKENLKLRPLMVALDNGEMEEIECNMYEQKSNPFFRHLALFGWTLFFSMKTSV